MTKGFELVREINVGELEAPDRSTLRGKALLPMAMPESSRPARGADRLPHDSAAAGPGAHTPLTRVAEFDACSGETRLQPAGQRLRVARHHGRGQRRHRVEIRRPPRNAALYSRELHAVHGVHRGLPRHGAPQLLAGSRDDSAHRGQQLRERRQRAAEDAEPAAGDQQADARDDARRAHRQERRAACAGFIEGHHEVNGFSPAAKEEFFNVIDKVPMAYQKANAIFRDAGEEEPGLGRHLLDLRLGSLQGVRGVRHRLRRARGAADGAGDRGGQRRARKRHRVPQPAARRRRSISASTTTRGRRTRRRRRCATC